jgi:transketolase
MTESLVAVRRRAATTLLHMYKKANAGHIGASLSCLEILLDLYLRRCRPQDLVVLSKGHAAAGLYVALVEAGRMDAQSLDTFYKDGTLLAAHPPCNRQIADIPFGTGSLGHGLSLAAGVAFSTRFTLRDKHVYCIVSDGDCNEGSQWEAALFAGHHRLDNLTIIVDRNRLQGYGSSDDVLNLEPLVQKFESFGFATVTADNGNNFESLGRAFDDLKAKKGPKCIVANTTKGHGVSYMAGKMEWHYLPMNDAQFAQALAEVERA